MAKITISIPNELMKEMTALNKRLAKLSRRINWSKVAQHRFRSFINHENARFANKKVGS